MARNKNTRPGSSPYRGSPRSRTAARPSQRAVKHGPQTSDSTVSAEELADQELSSQVSRRGFALTRRAGALLVLVAIMIVSYASSLRVFFAQRQQMASTRAEIENRKQNIANLEDEINRWKDNEYVKTQARQRLGWVIPGEVGYRVVDSSGKPLGGGAEISSESGSPLNETNQQWASRLWGSVQAADNPVPVEDVP